MKTNSRFTLTLVKAALVCGLALSSRAADIVWTNMAGGNWTNAANWSPRQVPGAADNAFLTNSGYTYLVTNSSPTTVKKLMLGGAAKFWLAGKISGAAISTQGSGTAAIQANGGTLDQVVLGANVEVTNATTLHISNGLTLTNGATITLSPGNTATYLYFDSGTQSVGGQGDIVLLGMYSTNSRVRLGAGGQTTLTLAPNVTVTGRGIIDSTNSSTLVNLGSIEAGTALSLTNLTLINSGALSASSPNVLSVYSTNWSNNGVIEAENTTVSLDGVGTNAGWVHATLGSTVSLKGTWNNQGTIEAESATVTLDGAWTNGAGIYAGPGSTVSLRGTWNNQNGAITNDQGVLNLEGSFTQAGLGKIRRSGGTVNLKGTLSGGLSLTEETGDWVLSGTIKSSALDNVIATTGRKLLPDGGTLDNVHLWVSLSIDDGKKLYITNGLTLQNGASLTLNATNNSTFLYFGKGSQSLDAPGEHDAIVLAGSTNRNFVHLGVGGATMLTIGPGITVRGQGFITNNPSSSSILTNRGTIRADVPAAMLCVTNLQVNNLGALEAVNGGYLNLNGLMPGTMGGTVALVGSNSSMNLSGTNYSLPASGVTVGANQQLTLNGSWANAGTLTLSAGTLNLGGAFTQTGLGSFQRTGGIVNLTGSLSNGLALDATTGSWNLNGTISGGTVTATNGAELVLAGGTLNGVNLDANIDVDDGKSFYITNGLTFANGARVTLNATSNNTVLILSKGIQVIGGTGSIVLAGSTNRNFVQLGMNGATTLEIGTNVALQGQGFITNSTTASLLTNRGTIVANVLGKTLCITNVQLGNSGALQASNGGNLNISGLVPGPLGGTLALVGSNSFVTLSGTNYSLPASGVVVRTNQQLTLNGNWPNASTLALSNGTLNLGGVFTQVGLGEFQRTGGTVNLIGVVSNGLALNAKSGAWNLQGTILGGTVAASEGAKLIPGGGTLSGVNLAADIDVEDGKSFCITNGLTFSNGAKVTLNAIRSNTSLFLSKGAQTIGGTGWIVLAGSTNRNFVQLGTNGATLLAIGTNVTVQGQGFITNLTVSSILTNRGTIQADVAGQALTINLSGLTNNGALNCMAGTLALSTTAFSQTSEGTTLLQGGGLSASSQLRFSGGTLGGTGTITANVLNDGATIAPGQPLGLLTISGNYTQTSNGIFSLELGGLSPGTTFDRLAVTRTASLAGKVRVTLTNGFQPPGGSIFAFLTATNRSGMFDTLSCPANDCLPMSLTSAATNVSLAVFLVPPGGLARSIVPSGNTMNLQFLGQPFASYLVEWAPTPNGRWEPLETKVAPASGLVSCIDTNPPWPNGFYRLRRSN